MTKPEERKEANQIENNVEKKDGAIWKIKKATWALALTIALWSNPASANVVNDLKSYEDACLDSAAWEKVTILVSEEFYRKHRTEILKSIPQEDMCELKGYDRKTDSVNFPIIKKNGKKYFQISFKPVDWGEMDASDIVAQEQAEAEQAQKQAEQAQKQLEEMEKMVKAEWYLWDLQKKTIKILKNVENKDVVNSTLDEILKTLKIWNLKWNEYWEQIARWLKLVKIYYSDKDKEIVKKINKVLKKLNLN